MAQSPHYLQDLTHSLALLTQELEDATMSPSSLADGVELLPRLHDNSSPSPSLSDLASSLSRRTSTSSSFFSNVSNDLHKNNSSSTTSTSSSTSATTTGSSSSSSYGTTNSNKKADNVPLSQPDIVRLFLDEMAGGFPSQQTIDSVLQTYGVDPNTRLKEHEANYLIRMYFPERQVQEFADMALIHVASILGHTWLTKRLIAHGAHVNGTDKPGEAAPQTYKTPLMVAVENGNIDDIRALLKHRATIDFLPTFTSALYLSSVQGRNNIVSDFLAQEVVQNYLNRDRSLHCALWGAVQTRYYSIVDSLLMAGASPYLHIPMPEAVVPEGSFSAVTALPPFALALQGGDTAVVELLLSHATDLPLPLLSENLMTALARQVELNNIEVFKSLERYGYPLRFVVGSLDTDSDLLDSAARGDELDIDTLKAQPFYALHATRLFFVALENSQSETAKKILDHLFEISREYAAYTAGEGLDFLLKSNSSIVSDVGELFLSFAEMDTNALPAAEEASSSTSATSPASSNLLTGTSPSVSSSSPSSSSSSLSQSSTSPYDNDNDLYGLDAMMESFTTIAPSPPKEPEPEPTISQEIPSKDNPMWMMGDDESLAMLIELANTDKFKNHFIEVEQSLTGSLDSSRLVKAFFEASTKSHKKFVDASLKPEASSNFRGFARLFPSHLDLVRTGLETVKCLADGCRPSSLAQVYSFIHVASCMDIAQGSAGRRVNRDVLEQGFRLWRNCLSEFATLPFSPQEYADSTNKGTSPSPSDTGPPLFPENFGDEDINMTDDGDWTVLGGDDQLNYLSLGADETASAAPIPLANTYNEKALLDEIALAMVEEFESAMAWISAQTCDSYPPEDVVMDSFLTLDVDPGDIGMGGLEMSLTESSNGFRSTPTTPNISTSSSSLKNKHSEVGDLVGTFLFVSMAYFIKTVMRANDNPDEPKFKITATPSAEDKSNSDSIRAVLLDDLSEHGFLSLYGSMGTTVFDAVELGWLPSVSDAANFLIGLARLTFIDTPRALWKHTSTDFRYFVSNVLRLSCTCPAYGRLTCDPNAVSLVPPPVNSRFSFFGVNAPVTPNSSTPCCNRFERETNWSDTNILGYSNNYGVSAPLFIPGLDLSIPNMYLPPTPSSTAGSSSVFTPDNALTPFGGKPMDDPAFDLRSTLDTPLTDPSVLASPKSPITPTSPNVRKRKSQPAATSAPAKKRKPSKRSKKTSATSPKDLPQAIGVYVTCEICGKKIALNFKGNSKSNLIKHRETHNQTVTKCANAERGCTATFTRKDNMKAHIRSTCAFRPVEGC